MGPAFLGVLCGYSGLFLSAMGAQQRLNYQGANQ